ncbi:hypothetical protein BH10BAC2_BH10BAC2_11260 [soil metagenome]
MALITTLFAALADFFEHHKGDIASKMAASAGYDILKKSLNFKGLAAKIKGYFKKEEQVDQFIEQVCNQPIQEGEDPQTAIRTTYEKFTGDPFPPELMKDLKIWFADNREAIQQTTTVTFSQTSGFNIGAQQAKGNIYNVQGDYNKGNEPKED